MTRIYRDDFRRRLTDNGGQIRLTPRVRQDLRAAGVDRSRLDRIAGEDHVISGAEFNQLFDALATRGSGDTRASVSEDTFRSLQSHVERSRAAHGGAPAEPSARGTGRSVGIGGRAAAPRPGQPSLADSANVDGRTDGDRPGWFARLFESIAEFFVELFGGNYTTWDESHEDIGRDLARQHPESLRAILDAPNGEQRLRDHLIAQKPEGASDEDWNTTVDLIVRGMRAELASGADLPDDVGENASFAVRDAATPLYAADSSPAARQRLDRMLDSLASSGLSEQTQIRMLRDCCENGGDAAALHANLDRLAAASPDVRALAIAEIDANPSSFARVGELLTAAHDGPRANLNQVLFGDATLAEGAQGEDVRVAQRYLRALGYDGIVGAEVTGRYDADTRRAVAEFQRRAGLLEGNPPAAQEGVIDQATMRAMVDQMRTQGMDPTSYRFTTDLSLNRPTRANDRPWTARRDWTPELQQEFQQFADAYVRARIPRTPDGGDRNPDWHERVDCADLSYEALVQFARQRELPISLRGADRPITHRSARPAASARSLLGAMHIRQNTTPVRADEVPRPGDIGNMDWDQSVGNGSDSRYMHSHNIVSFDPLYRQGTVIYGSLDDLLTDRALEQFNRRGFDLSIHDISESQHIDAINDDSGQGRLQPRAEQERRVRALLQAHAQPGHTVTDADVDAFISMVSNEHNIRRNQPTAVHERASGWASLVDGQPWADPTARAAAVADLNRRFGASLTEADIDSIVEAGGRGRAAVDARIAELVRQRVPSDRRSGAADALADATRGTIRYRLNRDAVSDRGMRDGVRQDFSQRYGVRLSDRDLSQILRASSSEAALGEARTVLSRHGLSGDRLDQASRELRDGVDETRRFRRWDFAAFNRAR